jgi:hypothetical protein
VSRSLYRVEHIMELSGQLTLRVIMLNECSKKKGPIIDETML